MPAAQSATATLNTRCLITLALIDLVPSEKY